MREPGTEVTVERTSTIPEAVASDLGSSTTSARCWLVGSPVALNGKPALVIGGSSDFATIAALDGSAQFEWSWPSVIAIVRAGGHFES